MSEINPSELETFRATIEDNSFTMHCHICKKEVAVIDARQLVYNTKTEKHESLIMNKYHHFTIYCKQCHDNLEAVQARLQGHARSIFFTDEQLSILQKMLEKETKKYVDDQAFQDSIKNDNYDLMTLEDSRINKINRYQQVSKMYVKVNKSMSELGLFGN